MTGNRLRRVENDNGLVTRTLARQGWVGVLDPYDRRRNVYYRYRLPAARHTGAVKHVGVNQWRASIQQAGYLSKEIGIFESRTRAMKAVERAYAAILQEDKA